MQVYDGTYLIGYMFKDVWFRMLIMTDLLMLPQQVPHIVHWVICETTVRGSQS
ncbi:hypothetical protein D3C78_1047450 [compost metagenome]